MGNNVVHYAAMGAAESVMSDGQYVYGAADPRRAGALCWVLTLYCLSFNF